ncbi:hypothetical protein [Ralstonia wenshanensis]|uniref:hypothetical protein n=1 Tax=Ralstonia wenshanensis TaxID=2842456 RepID=UPI0021B493D4|nr:hypothetical protein [Ralstonia wenshanensis]MCT7308431.1 hypothetical protein [Ralstonia wenshanensis]
MAQNLISLQISTADLAAVDSALKSLEDKLIGLIDLSTEQRSGVVKMGDKSEAFCRKAVEVLGNNPGVLPGNFNMAEMRRDLVAFDTLRPRLNRFEKLYERMRDSQLALGSDLMSASLEGYAFLKIAGKGEGLDMARKALSAQFSNNGPKKKVEEVEASSGN